MLLFVMYNLPVSAYSNLYSLKIDLAFDRFTTVMLVIVYNLFDYPYLLPKCIW